LFWDVTFYDLLLVLSSFANGYYCWDCEGYCYVYYSFFLRRLSPALMPDIANNAALDPVIFLVLFSGLLY